MFDLRYGKSLEFMIERLQKSGKDLPPEIADAPELDPSLVFYFKCFAELSSTRSFGFGLGPIPVTAILEYCVFMDIHGIDREEFIYIIKSMDTTFLDYHREESDTKKS